MQPLSASCVRCAVTQNAFAAPTYFGNRARIIDGRIDPPMGQCSPTGQEDKSFWQPRPAGAGSSWIGAPSFVPRAWRHGQPTRTIHLQTHLRWRRHCRRDISAQSALFSRSPARENEQKTTRRNRNLHGAVTLGSRRHQIAVASSGRRRDAHARDTNVHVTTLRVRGMGPTKNKGLETMHALAIVPAECLTPKQCVHHRFPAAHATAQTSDTNARARALPSAAHCTFPTNGNARQTNALNDNDVITSSPTVQAY